MEALVIPSMDQNDLKAREMANNASFLNSHDNQDQLGKVKSASNLCGMLADASNGLAKQEDEINSCESEMEMKFPNIHHFSLTGFTKREANKLELHSVVSTSRNSDERENCAEGTSCAMSCCNGQTSSTDQNKVSGDGNLKDGVVYAQSVEGLHSTLYNSTKSEVSSEIIQHPNIEKNIKQPKTESSSSNSTHVTLPASSNDSCQASVDAKSCNQNRSSGLNKCFHTGFNSKQEELTAKSIVLGVAAQFSSLNTSLSQPGKCSNLGKASKKFDSGECPVWKNKDGRRVVGMIADENSVISEKIDFSKSSPLKKSDNVEECSDRDRMEFSYELDNAVEVACRIAREVVNDYRELSGSSSSSIEQTKDETLYPSSIDSAGPVKCESISSTKEVVNPDISVKEEDLCLQAKEMDPSNLLKAKVEDKATNEQIPHFCNFDLNEEIQENEDEAVNVLTQGPIRVVAKLGVPMCFPTAPLKFERVGWRGSSTTSAFRPASRSTSSAKGNEFKGIDLDLNVAAAPGDDFGSAMEVQDPVPSRRFEFDLNCLGESEDRPSPPSSSLSKQSMFDFDLNDNPSVKNRGFDADFHAVGKTYQTGLSSMQGYSQPFMVEQMQRIQPPPPPPQALVCNNGFYSSGTLPYITDQRGMTFVPLCSSNPAAFAVGPSPSEVMMMGRPSFDLNGGMSSFENGRQMFIPGRDSLMEEELKSFRQVGLPFTAVKRREPDGGWDSQQLGYRHQASWR